MNHLDEQIQAFLSCKSFAVSGASTNREKYGNKILRCYMQHNLEVHPINPRTETIENIRCYPKISALPNSESIGLSIITPPKITEELVKEAQRFGIKHIWMQPGAESFEAVEYCRTHNINVIAGNACLLVVLGYHENE